MCYFALSRIPACSRPWVVDLLGTAWSECVCFEFLVLAFWIVSKNILMFGFWFCFGGESFEENGLWVLFLWGCLDGLDLGVCGLGQPRRTCSVRVCVCVFFLWGCLEEQHVEIGSPLCFGTISGNVVSRSLGQQFSEHLGACWT